MPPFLPKAADGRSAVEVSRQCAREAGKIARAAFGRTPEGVGIKGPGDIVTASDFAIESLVIGIIETAFPDHSILSEETRHESGLGGWVWIIDPIDGTMNFARGIPLFCFNLALAFDGVPQLGLTYDPVRREEFFAVRGRGLRINGRAAAVSAAASLSEALVGFGLGYKERGALAFETLRHLRLEIQEPRAIGSAALGLAYAASGRTDLFFHNEVGGAWDFAAGMVLVEEAGGLITDRNGAPLDLGKRDFVAGAPAVQAQFLEAVRGKDWYQG